MQYYAKVNTAYPAAGFMPVGEVLTEKQVAALGEELLAVLVREGVLGTLRDAEEETTEEMGDDLIRPYGPPSPEGEGKGELETGEPETEEAADDEELPELEVPEDIVSEAPKAAKPAKSAGRRKAK